jgi:hypothetical protein
MWGGRSCRSPSARPQARKERITYHEKEVPRPQAAHEIEFISETNSGQARYSKWKGCL